MTTLKKEGFSILSYNLNGVRASAKKGLSEYIEKQDADILCFCEVRATEKQLPKQLRETFEKMGYNSIMWNDSTIKKGYSGTCVVSKKKPLSVKMGIGCLDDEGRSITVEYEKFYLVNTYVANSNRGVERRQEWDMCMLMHLLALQTKKPVIWTGDLNVAIREVDVYDGNKKARSYCPCFLPFERNNLANLLNILEMTDVFRKLYPDARKKECFTFYTNRGRDAKGRGNGWRLDYFITSKQIVDIITGFEIHTNESFSDHVPILLQLKEDPDKLL